MVRVREFSYLFIFISLLSSLFLSLLLCLLTHIETHCCEPMANPSTSTRSTKIHKTFITKSTTTKTHKSKSQKQNPWKIPTPKTFFIWLSFSFFHRNLGFLFRVSKFRDCFGDGLQKPTKIQIQKAEPIVNSNPQN